MCILPEVCSTVLINSQSICYRQLHLFREINKCTVQEGSTLAGWSWEGQQSLDLNFFICKMKLLKFIRSGILGPEFHGPPGGLWMEVHDATENKCQVLWVHMCIFLGGGSTAFIRDSNSVWSKIEKATFHCRRLSLRSVTAVSFYEWWWD